MCIRDSFNIFPSDSVITSLPIFNNQLFITKFPANGDLKTYAENSEFKLKYKPDQGFLGLDTFQVVYFVPGENNNLSKKSKQVIIRVSSFILNADTYTVYTDDTLNLAPFANDELAGQSVRLTFLPLPAKSNLLISADSLHIRYEGSGSARIEHLSYVACTADGICESGNFKLIVRARNENSDMAFNHFMRKNSTLELEHPYDSMLVSAAPAHGMLVTDGFKLSYTPDTAFTGSDTFDIGFSNGTATHQFIIHVLNFENNNLLAFDDYFYVLADHTGKLDVLKNDFTRDVTVTIFDQPTHGTLTRQSNGVYNYKPGAGYTGLDVFIYQACEPNSNTCEYAVAYVTTGKFEPDYTSWLSTSKNTHINIDYPFPTSGYKLSVTNYPDHGTLRVLNNGTSMQYKPAQNYTGVDSLKIKYCLNSDPTVCYPVKIYIQVFDVNGDCSDNCLWPGDHNTDGRVDMRDLTFMAPFIGVSGKSRDTSLNSIWIGQNSDEWQRSSNKVNLKHADSDGNAVLTVADTLWLSHNYRKSHGINVNRGFNNSQLPFKLKSDKALYNPGDSILVTVSIGDQDWAIQNLNGFTVSFSFSDAFRASTLTGEIMDESWLSQSASLLQMVKKPGERILDFGAARIGGSGTPGYGRVGTINSIIDEQLQGWRDEDGIILATIAVSYTHLTLPTKRIV